VISVDTNVLVRLLTRDDEAQFKASRKLFAAVEIFIPDTVILETEWVLRCAYELQPAAVCDAFRRVFGLRNVHLANGRSLAQAIVWHEQGLDFADALHLAASQGSESLKTFDGTFIRRARKIPGCSVERP
jgi:predicted nucleic-acid-binding protein